MAVVTGADPEAIARQVGVDWVLAEVLPKDKAAEVEKLKVTNSLLPKRFDPRL